jgi:hypothetical protein
MNAQAMQVYLFILAVLNSLGAGAQGVVAAIGAMGDAIATKDVGKIADAASALMKSLSAIVDKFAALAHPHFTAHAALQAHEVQARVANCEAEFHRLFGGGLLGGGAGGTGAPAPGTGINIGGVLNTIKNNLPMILSLLQLFGVKLPVSLPTT